VTRRESVLVGTIVLAVARAARFGLGLVATLAIAHIYGTSAASSAFFVARVIPVNFMEWAGNILKVGFIPTHSAVRARSGEAAAEEVAAQFMGHGLLLFAIGTLLTIALAPWITRLFAPGFAPATAVLSVEMLRILAPSILAAGAFLLVETVLTAQHHFSSPARGRVWGRVIVVVALLGLARPLGARALPIAFLLGAVFELFALGASGRRALGQVRRVRLWPLAPGTRAVLRLLLPATTWMMLDQLKFAADQNFASRLPEGDLAALNYAFQIVQVVVSVTGGAYLTAMFPRLSEDLARGVNLVPLTTRAAHRVVTFAALSAALLLGGAAPVVSVLLERGAFGHEATRDTSHALFWFAPGVLFISINMLLKTLLFLGQRPAPMVWVGLLELALNVGLNAVLIGPMGVGGLALATSATTLVVMLVLPVYLARGGLLHPRSFFSPIVRVLPATGAAALVTWLVVGLFETRGVGFLALGLAIACAVGCVVFWGLARIAGLSLEIPRGPLERVRKRLTSGRAAS